MFTAYVSMDVSNVFQFLMYMSQWICPSTAGGFSCICSNCFVIYHVYVLMDIPINNLQSFYQQPKDSESSITQFSGFSGFATSHRLLQMPSSAAPSRRRTRPRLLRPRRLLKGSEPFLAHLGFLASENTCLFFHLGHRLAMITRNWPFSTVEI